MTSDYRVSLEEGTRGPVEVRRFEVPERSIEGLRMSLAGRGCQPGWYTGLYRNGQLWMSDTPAEQRDCYELFYQMRHRGGRVLMNGLGIGMTLTAALAAENVEHVDVVEIDPAVVELVGSQFTDPRVTIHLADAYDIKWPVGTRWNVVWHDIWQDICGDNAEGISRLKRKYGRRADWQAAWAEDEVRRANRMWG